MFSEVEELDMLKLRRRLVQSLGLSSLCAALPGVAQAQTLPKPWVIYDDGDEASTYPTPQLR
jgi:hypothetical protein